MCDSPGNSAASTCIIIGTSMYERNNVYLSNVKL